MKILEVLATYDAMFGNNSLEEIENFLREKMQEAAKEQDVSSLITLLNEIIGFTRDSGQREKSLAYCEQLKEIIDRVLEKERPEYATSLLNIANAYRAFGLWQESLKLHVAVEENYRRQLSETDFSFASLYNNWSLLYQEMNDFANAKEKLLLALRIVDAYPDKVIESATTRVNLANTLMALKTKEDYEAALQYLKEALMVYEKDGGRDFHYSAALTSMGDALSYREKYGEALLYYEKAMTELEKHVGKTPHYFRIAEKRDAAKKKSGTDTERNLPRCRKFYDRAVKPMIKEKFPDYENRIAVGMVGEGSDCYGFDDAISEDHDYGIGVCLWLTETDKEKIGASLQVAYEELLENEKTSKDGKAATSIESVDRLQNRRGVFSINEFYEKILWQKKDYEKGESPELEGVMEWRLAEATNGAVFCDELQIFTGVRSKLQKYYSVAHWRKRLSVALHEFSQYAQSNYPRMMARKDYVTASLCRAKASECVMDIWYLLKKSYAPYYKWKKKGMENLPGGTMVVNALEKLAMLPVQSVAWEGTKYRSDRVNLQDAWVAGMEDLAAMILKEMQALNLTEGNNLFLESYCEEIQMGKNMDLIERIVELEWKQFDKVKNEGGRAGCQDDWGTFSIMRKSQYLTWNRELLESFYQDLQLAEQKGWNLITEKYARMMESTAPEKYRKLEENLPVISDERKKIQEEMIAIQVGWMAEFAKQYPKMATNARSIYTSEDNEYNTSYETYLRGEISTYSDKTFLLYGKFVVTLYHEGKNLAYEIMNHTAKLYGYASVEDAESRIQGI